MWLTYAPLIVGNCHVIKARIMVWISLGLVGDETIRSGIMPPSKVDDITRQLFESANFSKDCLWYEWWKCLCLSTHSPHLCNYCGPLPTRKLYVIPIANR